MRRRSVQSTRVSRSNILLETQYEKTAGLPPFFHFSSLEVLLLMPEQFLQAGRIVNTHALRGEVKIAPWCDTPDFLCSFPCFYVDGRPVRVESARVHKSSVIAKLAGVDSVEDAQKLKNTVICIDRDQAQLPEGRHFLADLIGLEVRDAESGAVLGRLAEVLDLPAQDVYVVQGGEREYMIPAVDEFLVQTNVDEGYILVRVLEGMGS